MKVTVEFLDSDTNFTDPKITFDISDDKENLSRMLVQLSDKYKNTNFVIPPEAYKNPHDIK